MQIAELNSRWPGYWHVGKGKFVVVCTADRRVNFCETRERGNEIFHWGCAGRKCAGESQHIAFKLENEPPAQPARISRAWKQMVEAE